MHLLNNKAAINVFFFFLFVCATACKKDKKFPSDVLDGPQPVSAFTFAFDPSNARMVSFTNTSADALTYFWEFGDGTSSTDQHPVHEYAAAGRYVVSLTVKSSAGYFSEISETVVAAAPATADFSTEYASGVFIK